ncbi:MAG: hypothetical protein ACI8V5_001289, partial [Limisphaerales bacterium]
MKNYNCGEHWPATCNLQPIKRHHAGEGAVQYLGSRGNQLRG